MRFLLVAFLSTGSLRPCDHVEQLGFMLSTGSYQFLGGATLRRLKGFWRLRAGLGLDWGVLFRLHRERP